MKLKDLIPLKSKITVYVPATVDINKEIDNTAQVERVARLLSECFGGATSSPLVGIGWLRTALWWLRKRRWFSRTVIRRRLKSTSTMLLLSAMS